MKERAPQLGHAGNSEPCRQPPAGAKSRGPHTAEVRATLATLPLHLLLHLVRGNMLLGVIGRRPNKINWG